MIDYIALKNELRRDEGVRSKPYLDTVGKWTIGVGRNLSDRGLDDEEIDTLLENDIADCECDLDNNILWWRNLSPNRKRALINMCFNLGISRLMNFKNMITALKNGNYNDAANEALNSKWAKQVGLRAKRIADIIKEG